MVACVGVVVFCFCGAICFTLTFYCILPPLTTPGSSLSTKIFHFVQVLYIGYSVWLPFLLLLLILVILVLLAQYTALAAVTYRHRPTLDLLLFKIIITRKIYYILLMF